MARSAKIEGILFETDAAELVVARDLAGTVYLGMRVERVDGRDRFLWTPISARRLADLRHGQVDLRDAFERSETGDAYSADYSGDNGAIDLAPVKRIPARWLPDRGFPLVDFLPAANEDDLILEAVAQHKRG